MREFAASFNLFVSRFVTHVGSLQNNLVRCSLGALFVSVIQIILNRLHPGWTYVLITGICIAFFPVQFVLLRYGPVWRAKRRAQRQAAEAAPAKL